MQRVLFWFEYEPHNTSICTYTLPEYTSVDTLPIYFMKMKISLRRWAWTLARAQFIRFKCKPNCDESGCDDIVIEKRCARIHRFTLNGFGIQFSAAKVIWYVCHLVVCEQRHDVNWMRNDGWDGLGLMLVRHVCVCAGVCEVTHRLRYANTEFDREK